MSTTPVLAPVPGRAVPLGDVPDPVFSQGMVGYGAAIDPPRGVIEAVAPVSGRLLKLMPHAYIVMTPENVGDAVGAVRPFAVDTASGTEAEPGRKDPAKLDAFFRAVAAADERAAA